MRKSEGMKGLGVRTFQANGTARVKPACPVCLQNRGDANTAGEVNRLRRRDNKWGGQSVVKSYRALQVTAGGRGLQSPANGKT